MEYTNLIKHIDFELSSICNARCPVCPRLFDGQFTNFTQTYHTLETTQRIFDEDLIKGLENLTICGNFGDGMGNPDILGILIWFKTVNPKLNITINTNGGIGKPETYAGLAKIGCNMIFGIDGYGEVNELYRVNVKWEKLERNIKSFVENANFWQFKVQFIAWAETTDQLIPLIDFLKPLKCNELYIRSPFTHDGGITKVYDVKGNPSHNLTKVEYEPFFELLESRWSLETIDILKEKLISIQTPVKPLQKLGSDTPTLTIDRAERKYEITDFKFNEDEEISVRRICKQNCQSINSFNPSDSSIDNFFLYITHDNYLMPCCMIPPFISTAINFYTGRETNSQKEILNKVHTMGLENFDLKNKTIREIFNSGIIHQFVYDDIRNKNSFYYCKMMCGRC